MIYRETYWRDGDVAVVETIPLSGENLPIDFARFRYRTTFQHILASGPVTRSCNIALKADNVVDAMAEAAVIKPIKDRELSDGLAADVNRTLVDEINATTKATQPAMKAQPKGEIK